MSDSIRVAVAGACGRMGQEVVRTVLRQPDMTLVAAFDMEPVRGQDIGVVTAGTANGVLVTADPESVAQARPHVVVDFTRFDAAPHHLRRFLFDGIAAVVGTTGIPQSALEELGEIASDKGTGLFVAPNFSLGAVLMMMFAQQAARYFDWAEIIELHHEKKLDAPSGTALRTAEMMLEKRTAFAAPPSETLKLEGVRGGLKAGVRIHSVRLPGFLAHQEVLFGGEGEVLTLRHDSTNRTSFMPGVMLAVREVQRLRGLVVGLERIMASNG